MAGAHDAEEVGNEEGAEHEEHREEGGVGLPDHRVREGTPRFPGNVQVKRSPGDRPKVRAVICLVLYVGQTGVNLGQGGTVAKHRREGMFGENLSKLLEGRDNEKKGNKGVEDVLGEPSEVADESRSLEKGDHERDDESPDSDPEPPWEELSRKRSLGEVKESLVVEEDWPGDSCDDERAAREEREEETTHCAENNCLRDPNSFFCTFAHQASKCNCTRETSKVDENGGSNCLGVEAILDVIEVLWIPLLDVTQQPSERSTCPTQRVTRWSHWSAHWAQSSWGLFLSRSCFRLCFLSLLDPSSHVQDVRHWQQVTPVPVARRQQHQLGHEGI